MNLFNKLLMMRQLKFESGKISIFDQPLMLSPREMYSSISVNLIERPELIPRVYEGIRVSVRDGWAQKVKKQYRLKPLDYMLMMFDIGRLTGWGDSHLLKFDVNSLSGSLKTLNASVALELKRSNVPVDILWRAQGAGVSSGIFGHEMDWVETKCLAKGDPVCEFHFMQRKDIKKGLFSDQIPV